MPATTSPIKVLHLIDQLAVGGAQRVVKNLVEDPPEGISGAAYALRTESSLLRIDGGVAIDPARRWYSPAPLWRVRRYLIEHPVDVLHCHLYKAQIVGCLLRALWFPRVKVIYHEQGNCYLTGSGHSLLLRWMDTQVDLFIAASEAMKTQLVRRGGLRRALAAGRVVVLPNAISLEWLQGDRWRSVSRDALRMQLGIPAAKYCLGFVGRLEAQKGCRYFIETIRCLGTDYLGVVVGEGSERAYLEQLAASLGCRDRVHFAGFRQEDLGAFYRAFDALVVPSIFEGGGPLAALDALAVGTPVVASDAEGVDAVVPEQTGLTFRARDARDCARQVQRLMGSADLRHALAENAAGALAHRSYAEYKRSLGDLYRGVVRQSG